MSSKIVRPQTIARRLKAAGYAVRRGTDIDLIVSVQPDACGRTAES